MNRAEAVLRHLTTEKRRLLRQGDHLFRQGDNVEHLYIVCQGRVKPIRHTIDGNAIVLQAALAQEIIAEASLFAETYHCSAVVESRSAELACLNRQQLLTRLRQDSGAAMEVVELFVRRLRALLEIRNIRSARGRIYSYFQLEAGGEVPLRLSYKDMAYQLGLAHETFYRHLKCLEQEGKRVRKTASLHLL